MPKRAGHQCSLVLYIDSMIILFRIKYDEFKRDFKTKSKKTKLSVYVKEIKPILFIVTALIPWLNTIALVYNYYYAFKDEFKYAKFNEKIIDTIISSSKFSLMKYIFKYIRKNGKKSNRQIQNNIRKRNVSGKKPDKSRGLSKNNSSKKQ